MHPSPRPMADTFDGSETLAIRAFGFLLNSGVETERLFSHIGIKQADLVRPLRPEQMAATLDFLIKNEAALLNFARTVDVPPHAAYEARRLLRHETAARSGPSLPSA